MSALERNLAMTPAQLHVRQCKQGYRQGQCSRTRLACGDFCAMGEPVGNGLVEPESNVGFRPVFPVARVTKPKEDPGCQAALAARYRPGHT